MGYESKLEACLPFKRAGVSGATAPVVMFTSATFHATNLLARQPVSSRHSTKARSRRVVQAATRRLLTLQEAAIQTFQDVLSDAQASPGVRVRAAQAVLDYLLKIRMLHDVAQRLTALEEAQQRRPQW